MHSLLRCNKADFSLLWCGVLHQHTATDLLADLVYREFQFISYLGWKGEKKLEVLNLKSKPMRTVFSDEALTGSSGFWLTSWRGSSGRWSRRIRVNSLMNTASPSLAHTATWKTRIFFLGGVLQVNAPPYSHTQQHSWRKIKEAMWRRQRRLWRQGFQVYKHFTRGWTTAQFISRKQGRSWSRCLKSAEFKPLHFFGLTKWEQGLFPSTQLYCKFVTSAKDVML